MDWKTQYGKNTNSPLKLPIDSRQPQSKLSTDILCKLKDDSKIYVEKQRAKISHETPEKNKRESLSCQILRAENKTYDETGTAIWRWL